MTDLAPVAATGDRLKTLEALRDRLARQIDESNSSRDVAALSRQLTEVLAQIAELVTDDSEKEDDLAQLIALPGGAG